MNPYDYVNSINSGKNIMVDTITEKGYDAFKVNKALSYFPDTLAWANEMNLNRHLDKKLQYEFLLNTIRPRKRFKKWVKPERDEYLELLCTYYKCNYTRGREILDILNSSDIDNIKERMNEGGL